MVVVEEEESPSVPPAARPESSNGDAQNGRSSEEIPYPLDVIVQNIQNVVHSRDADDSSDDDAAKEVNHALKLQGFNVVERENGADCEFLSYEPAESNRQQAAEGDTQLAGGQQTMKAKFKKGHRRAFSMPSNAHHRDKAVLVVAENNFRQEGPNRRHLVRYRLHPYTPNTENDAAINQFIEETRMDPDDDDIEVTYDEEEIVNIGGGRPGTHPLPPGSSHMGPRWKVQNFDLLPEWLQDNEFLRTGHRPPLPSFASCFNSVFHIHSETGNIWTHLYGCVAFISVAICFLSRANELVYWKDKLCHSQGVGKLFSKLDYSGITLLIVGSFVPFMYYGFYCRTLPMLIYVTMISVLGLAALVVSLWDKFAEPKFRPLRAIVFVAMGLSSVVPCGHLLITDGFEHMINYDSLHWIVLMGLFYLVGAGHLRVPLPRTLLPRPL
ncbi:Adiponectin receptor protein [Aphelenchoides fujianensis]|nr:Adiponectin receptor protein [Aphelenchoides fujianensis]